MRYSSGQELKESDGQVMDNLEGKVAIVTGAASGIGLALAKRFLAEGMKVVMADVEEPVLQASASQLRADGGDLEAITTDVSDLQSVESLSQAAIKRFGTYHVVCNNAGVGGQLGRVWEVPLPVYKWVIDVNLWGVIYGIRTFVPRLVEQGEGHVVNTASLAAWGATPSVGPYAATKHAVLGLTEGLRRDMELAGINVGVSIFCPGGVNTNILNCDRNWPAALGEEPPGPTDPASQAEQEALKTRTAGRVDPSVAADVVLDGVLTNRFVLTTHPDQLHDLVAMRDEAAAEAIPVK
jgi:NAD(P)-dependent dehydrogenase (short-subunit alcohol dehydrogenase family)